MLKCNFVFCGMCLSRFSHNAVRILASPESITGGAPNCETGELKRGLGGGSIKKMDLDQVTSL